MNLILFDKNETALPLADPRAVHLLQTLGRREGDTFDAGIVNGPRTKGTIREITGEALLIEFETAGSPPPLHPVSLLVGMPRPQTARKILREATALGVEEIHFAPAEKGEPSYAASRLWSTGEYRRHLIAGAEQAFTTRVPELKRHKDLGTALDESLPGRSAIALDNYEATSPLRDYRPAQSRCLLAVGSERGWSAAERDLFRARDIPLLRVGSNVLRTETACVCALAILLANWGLI